MGLHNDLHSRGMPWNNRICVNQLFSVDGMIAVSSLTVQVKAEEKAVLDYLRGRVEAVVADKIAEVVDFAKSSNDFITAGAAAALEHVPATLQWRHCGSSPCFHAEDQEGRLYSINLAKGIVLLDGYPPRTIPESILQHELYKRCFGNAVFEVSVDKSGTFKTSRPVDGCFYEFQELSDGQLRITEVMERCSVLAISNFICFGF